MRYYDLYIVVSDYVSKVTTTCHIRYLAADQVYCRFVLVMESFWAFQFFPSIAVCESFVMNGAYTIYGGIRKRVRVILKPAPRFCSVAIILNSFFNIYLNSCDILIYQEFVPIPLYCKFEFFI